MTSFCSSVVTSPYRNYFHRTAEVLAIGFCFKYSPWKIIQWKMNVEDFVVFFFFPFLFFFFSETVVRSAVAKLLVF